MCRALSKVGRETKRGQGWNGEEKFSKPEFRRWTHRQLIRKLKHTPAKSGLETGRALAEADRGLVLTEGATLCLANSKTHILQAKHSLHIRNIMIITSSSLYHPSFKELRVVFVVPSLSFCTHNNPVR